MTDLIMIGLNELNFDFVRRYVAQGELRTLGRLIARHGVTVTSSEQTYPEWEPWIQWVTVQTGQSLAQHGVFRLGDIVRTDHKQIWEALEDRGVSVGAVSPMNAANRTRAARFFLPDPWTDTRLDAPFLERVAYEGARRAVLANAEGRMGLGVLVRLGATLPFLARPASYKSYIRLAALSVKRPWARAIFLDLLLSDIFQRLLGRQKPRFATLFLNAAAHLQHHYMFNSRAYLGNEKNPAWYIDHTDDPILEIYRVYDSIISDVIKRHPDARLLLATALHQEPHARTTYYWRLKDHRSFIESLGVTGFRVEPLMSRDFVLVFSDAASAAAQATRLASVTDEAGRPLFSIDNRGTSLFIELIYDNPVGVESRFRVGNGSPKQLLPHVAFVAIKNGEHRGEGYLLDTAATPSTAPAERPLSDVHGMMLDHFSALGAQAA